MSSTENRSSDAYDALVIRPATEADSGAIAEVHLAARRAAPMPPSPQSDEAVRFWLDGKLQGGDETWVADVDGAVAGYARLAGSWLDDLYVAPALAGRGVGSALLDVIKAVRPDGFRLWVFAMNEPARVFYGARGVVELEVTDGLGNPEQAPDILCAWPGREPVRYLRSLIDEVDADLAHALARRRALTATIQTFKPVGGLPGRDTAREREIAHKMAAIVPELGPARLERIMHEVITASLESLGDRPADGSGSV